MKYTLKTTTKFKKDYKRCKKRGYDMDLLSDVQELSGNRDGQHSIRINDQYRICFYWNNGNVIIEDICDYY